MMSGGWVAGKEREMGLATLGQREQQRVRAHSPVLNTAQCDSGAYVRSKVKGQGRSGDRGPIFSDQVWCRLLRDSEFYFLSLRTLSKHFSISGIVSICFCLTPLPRYTGNITISQIGPTEVQNNPWKTLAELT